MASGTIKTFLLRVPQKEYDRQKKKADDKGISVNAQVCLSIYENNRFIE